MNVLNYLPIIVLVVDLILYVAFSIRLHRLMRVCTGSRILLLGLVFAYINIGPNIGNMSKALFMATITMTLVILQQLISEYKAEKVVGARQTMY